MAEEIALKLNNITKIFPGVIANKDVNFELHFGEIHALLGENGAGKSTLMNIVYGLYDADGGTIEVKGEIVKIKSPKDAIALGIGMVHQHFMLVPRLSVVENVILGMDENLRKIDMIKAKKEVQALLDKYNFKIDVNAKVRDLSVGTQQKVEIIKALYRGADILILDEPTAVLTPLEVEELIIMAEMFKKSGKAIIFISHKLWEVKKLSDRVTVLRAGEVAGTVVTASITKEGLASMMVGREVLMAYNKNECKPGKAVLNLENVIVKGINRASDLKNLNIEVRMGEIVGIAGVDGNGQSEIAAVIMGLHNLESGRVLFQGCDISQKNTRKRIQDGMAHIPEDRFKDAIIKDFSIAENLILDDYDIEPYTKNGVFSPAKVVNNAKNLIKEFDIRPPFPNALIKKFSGGNQQKVVIARELSRNPKFVLAMQPTRGLDIGAVEFVHERLLAERDKGKGVLLISADLDELLIVCDYILVLYEGEIMGSFVPGKISLAEIGMMMGGTKRDGETSDC
ncbi:MAG: ABC transporter ATP-binding protein [Clostridia bacterium]